MRRQYDYIFWKGRKLPQQNDVGDDGIVDGWSAITKTMRIRACLIGRQIRIPFLVMVSRHAREFCGSRKSWGCGEWEFKVNACSWTDQITKIVILRNPSHIFISNNLTNRDRAPWATIVLTAYFFGGYWRKLPISPNSHRGEARGCKWKYNNCGILQITIGYPPNPD